MFCRLSYNHDVSSLWWPSTAVVAACSCGGKAPLWRQSTAVMAEIQLWWQGTAVVAKVWQPAERSVVAL